MRGGIKVGKGEGEGKPLSLFWRFFLSSHCGKTMNAFSQVREGGIFKISMVGAKDTCKKIPWWPAFKPLVSEFLLIWPPGDKGLYGKSRAAFVYKAIFFTSLSLVEKILCYPSGLQSSLTVRNWEVNPMQTTGALTQGWQGALERGGGSGKSFPLAKGKYFPWLSSPPSVCRCTAPRLGWIPEWSNNSVPFGDQINAP